MVYVRQVPISYEKIKEHRRHRCLFRSVVPISRFVFVFGFPPTNQEATCGRTSRSPDDGNVTTQFFYRKGIGSVQ